MYGVVRYADPAGTPMNNAYWIGARKFMAFGNADKLAGALDVVAHEMTHAVVNTTADLVYQNQSGALNESFADIFGDGA